MKTVYVLGAGVDRALGLPLANELLRELDAFSKSDGKDLSQAIKGKLGGPRRVPFNFEKYVANQGEAFPERMLLDPGVAPTLINAFEKLGPDASDGSRAVAQIISRLDRIREANELDNDTAEALAILAGESAEMADSLMLRFRGIMFTPGPRDALVKVFRDLQALEGLSQEEKSIIDSFVAAMTNIEDLLTELFAGFYTGNAIDIRKFLYVSWLLWGYMWWKSQTAQESFGDTESFYRRLEDIGDDDSVITFNYTALGSGAPERTVTLHGDCYSYIRQDRGEMISNDERVTEATSLDDLRNFIDTLEFDIEKRQILLPAIVPPSAMKPVIHHSFVTRWAEADIRLRESQLIVAVGYAFNRIDNHFNDLFRSAVNGKRVAVINPDLNGSVDAVCGLLGRNRDTLTTVTMSGISVQRSDQLLFVPAKCEEVGEDMLANIKGGWSH